MEIITLNTKNQLIALFGNKPQDCICAHCSKELDEERYASYYQCAGCDRVVPYCFGQADRWFDYCDDCAVYLQTNDTGAWAAEQFKQT